MSLSIHCVEIQQEKLGGSRTCWMLFEKRKKKNIMLHNSGSKVEVIINSSS
jgi:hypothetical protein